MCDNEPRLIDPTEDLFDAWRDGMADYRAAGEGVFPGAGAIGADGATVEALAEAVELARHHAKAVGLPEGWVPSDTYWLIGHGRILGMCNLRHRLTESLKTFGGHIGYSIRPSERRKGYGALQLRLVLAKARALGIDRALVTCDKDNEGSAGVIRANGGVFEGEGRAGPYQRITQRYWIELGGKTR